MERSSPNIARADISLAALKHNFDLARELAPTSKAIAVIKANAYGHGAVQAATALPADRFAVARVAEAVELRDAGVEQPIVLLEGVIDEEEAQIAAELNLEVTVHTRAMLALLPPEVGIWLKIDTGMHRLGLSPVEFGDVISSLRQPLLGVLTHFSHADEADRSTTLAQLARFEETTGSLGVDRSAANSAGVLGYPESHYNHVRPGLMLYGVSPFGPLDERLQPVMTFSAPVIAVREVAAGETIGYNGIWQAAADTKVAVLAVGYADGYPREVSADAEVFLAGARRPVIGRVSMDMIIVALGDDDVVSVGDRAELWGSHVRIEEVAHWSGTIPYTLMCGVSPRVPRHYIEISPES